MTKEKTPKSAVLEGIYKLMTWWVNHPVSHTVIEDVKRRKFKTLTDKDPKESAQFFLETFFESALEENIPGDEWVEFVNDEHRKHKEGTSDIPSLRALYLVVIACAYYAQAINEADENIGWSYIASLIIMCRRMWLVASVRASAPSTGSSHSSGSYRVIARPLPVVSLDSFRACLTAVSNALKLISISLAVDFLSLP